MLFTEKNGSRAAYSKDPAVVKVGKKYFLYFSSYYEDGGREKLGIGIATSNDGERWSSAGKIPLTQECEKNGIGAPTAIVLQGKVHLFYQSYGNWKRDAILHAVSDDGLHFEKDESNPVFRPTEDWCAGRAIDADVVPFQGKLYLYFATRDFDMQVQMVGVAVADLNGDFSRGCWQQGVAAPVLKPEYAWEGECIEAPATVVHDNKIYLFYGGSYNCTPQQIGAAVSEDGVHFKKLFQEPFLRAGEAGSWNSSESGHPYVFRDDDGKVWLYYQGSGDQGESWYLSKCEIGFCEGLPRIL